MAVRAAENLLKLSELEPLPKPLSYEEKAAEEAYRALQWLISQRVAAECAKKTAKSLNAAELVDQWVAALLGEEPPQGMRQMANPGPAAQELVHRFVPAATAAAGPRPAAEQPPAETVGAEPQSAEPLGAGAPETAANANCHMRHTPAAAMTPDDSDQGTADVTATHSAAGASATPAATCGAPTSPSAPPKNPPDMTVSREPWEDEYERLMEERKTIRLPMGAVVCS